MRNAYIAPMMKQLFVQITRSQKAQLTNLAYYRRKTIKALFLDALERYYKQRGLHTQRVLPLTGTSYSAYAIEPKGNMTVSLDGRMQEAYSNAQVLATKDNMPIRGVYILAVESYLRATDAKELAKASELRAIDTH